tara:strand:- start:302 stop:496 length:195 start_codon:yes stop_codon:yes gene_type:complete
MIRTNDLKSLQNSLNSLIDLDTLDKDSVVDCLNEIFDILMKMNKMKVESIPYSWDTLIVRENEE